MERISAVIGAQAGDEGKGKLCDFLASESSKKSLVVRHNSSSQAGHTVQVEEKRHVFSHFGSGSLRNASTLLAHKFVAVPWAFLEEQAELAVLGLSPILMASKNLALATPLDALLNQITEAVRGGKRHGSCGMGFGESIQRTESNVYSTLAIPGHPSQFEEYFKQQLKSRSINLALLPPDLKKVTYDVLRGTFNWDRWFDEIAEFKGAIELVDDRQIQLLLSFNNIIFEGAQGLLLHQNHPNFPHVTRSRTGIEDVVEYLGKMNIIREVVPYYCSRAYVTRHGAGPLPNEKTLEEMTALGYNISDPTNVPNQFQGSLRFAELDMQKLLEQVKADFSHAKRSFGYKLVISCCDQVPERVLKIVRQHADILGFGADSKDTKVLTEA
jgi:adenylosuccinate synthase